ncbi:hypothetical protein FF38_11084 [Lucilia cuprina]|uniref:Uncharacterized protein n=1 Tax=Lucilia cuprina TaxID=7375 RepID=A0A0L0CRQ2_LUCCU|nr:hypothetical protein FF38_11084 [Lucilia cuprina]
MTGSIRSNPKVNPDKEKVITGLKSKFQHQLQKRRYNLVFYEYLCTPHSSVIKIFDCDFRKLRMNHYTFSENLMFGKNMAKGFNVRVYVDVNQWGGKKGIHFINVKMDACEAIKMVFENQVLSTLLVELRRTSNVPYLCPFKGNYLYSFQNFSFTDKFLPNFTPLVNFTFGLDFYEFDKLLGTTKISGATNPKVGVKY